MKFNLTEIVRKLRNNPTPAEKFLWDFLRRRSTGRKIKRQQPIKFLLNSKRQVFIADFYCGPAKLVIEIDGKVHEKQKDQDVARDFLITHLGFKVIRFTNDQVFYNTEEVFSQIAEEISIRAPLAPASGKGVGG